MEVQSNENAALLKLLKSKSRTKTEVLKVSSARRRARQAALDALLAEGKVIRIDREYFANDPSGSVEQLIDAEAARLDAYLLSVPDALARSGSKLRRAVKDNALASVALQRLLENRPGDRVQVQEATTLPPFGTLTPTIRSGASFSRNITGSRSRSLVAGG